MEHVGIDLGSKESQICIRSEGGEILWESRVPTKAIGKFLEGRGPSQVVVETSGEAFGIADLARAAGHQVKVVPARFAPMLGVGARGIKNDVRDARALSQASVALDELPGVHVPSVASRDAKALNTTRELLVRQRTQLCNRIRAFFRGLLGGLPKCAPETLPKRARARLGSDGPSHIAIAIEHLEHLNEAIKKLDREVEAMSKADPVCKRLRTVPGVGAVTAVRFAAAIDDPSRFDSADQVASYFGLTPGENTTGFKTKRTSITKAGPAPVRRALVQAAWAFWRTRPNHPPALWALAVAERRGKKIAVVALAAKLARIMFAMMRDKADYKKA
jgi:transposase